MRHRRTVATAALIAVVGLTVAALVQGANPSSPGVARFRETVVAHQLSGVRAGATETWRTQVWLLHTDQAVGTGLIACIRADTDTTIRECDGTYVLPRGRIQVAGQVIDRTAFQLSVVGGSGVYGGAGGVMFVLPPGLVSFFLTG